MKTDIYDQIIEDQKQVFRIEQIATEGNDPAVTGEKEMDIGGTSGMGAGGGGFFFFIAPPSPLAAAINSLASFSDIGLPEALFEELITHNDAR